MISMYIKHDHDHGHHGGNDDSHDYDDPGK